MTDAIIAEGLSKAYGPTRALDGIDLRVPAGTVLGLLGPNGAGKTTAVRILTTLLRPDAGRAWVAGLDVDRDAARLRRLIGLTGQYAAVDGNLTGRENLRMVGRLHHLTAAEARLRADRLLDRFELVEAGDRPVRTYSGGMRRRLDLGASLVNHPQVLFLDEPTTGLDPRSRQALWGTIRELVSDGTTLLLTTQYLEEADVLADRISVIDGGRVIAEGTSDELKSRVGGEFLDLRLTRPGEVAEALARLSDLAAGEPQIDAEQGRLSLPIERRPGLLAQVVRRLDDADVDLSDFALRRPTLDDVFLTLTGSTLPADEPADAPPSRPPAHERSKA